jgi:ankyrin repeat protein
MTKPKTESEEPREVIINCEETADDVTGFISRLIANDTNSRSQDEKNNPLQLLRHAIESNDLECVKQLLKYKPDLTLKNENEETAIDFT